MTKTNIFISHIHEDDEHIAAMKSLLSERGFAVRDSSINSERPNQAKDPDYIKGEILAPRIDWASTLVVLISPDTRNSEWVDWEIEYAQQQDKRIVGVWTHGAGECDIPDALDKYADAVVGWNGDRIQGAICGDVSDWEQSDGILIDLADWAGENFADVEDARRRYDQAKSETDAVAPPGWSGLDAAA